MKVTAWHGGQLLVAWCSGLFVAILLVLSFNVWDARFEKRMAAWSKTDGEVQRWHDESETKVESLPLKDRIVHDSIELRSNFDSLITRSLMDRMHETDAHDSKTSILKPIVWFIAVIMIPLTLLVWSWRWFGARSPRL